MGPVAAFRKCIVVNHLPKTRSGKILRATLRQIANSHEYKVPPTIGMFLLPPLTTLSTETKFPFLDNITVLDHVIERLNTVGHATKHKNKKH